METRSFTPLEIAKMLKQLEDALNKIGKVCNNLQKAGNIQDSIVLIQACQNLMRVHRKLSGAKKKPRKKILEKARQALTEKRGPKIPTVGIFRKISEDCIN